MKLYIDNNEVSAMNTAKIIASILILMSSTAQAESDEVQQATKVVTEALSRAFIIVKPINVSGDKITYEAIVAEKKCIVGVTLTATQEGTKRTLIDKLECK